MCLDATVIGDCVINVGNELPTARYIWGGGGGMFLVPDCIEP